MFKQKSIEINFFLSPTSWESLNVDISFHICEVFNKHKEEWSKENTWLKTQRVMLDIQEKHRKKLSCQSVSLCTRQAALVDRSGRFKSFQKLFKYTHLFYFFHQKFQLFPLYLPSFSFLCYYPHIPLNKDNGS